MRPRKNGERGAAFLEAALTIGVFMFTCITLADLLRLSYRTIVAQFIVSAALENLTRQDPTTDTAWTSLRAREAVCNRARDFGAFLSCENDIRICGGPDLNPADCVYGAAAPGVGRDYLMVGIRWPFHFTFGGDVNVTAEALGRNEPFPDAAPVANPAAAPPLLNG